MWSMFHYCLNKIRLSTHVCKYHFNKYFKWMDCKTVSFIHGIIYLVLPNGTYLHWKFSAHTFPYNK